MLPSLSSYLGADFCIFIDVLEVMIMAGLEIILQQRFILLMPQISRFSFGLFVFIFVLFSLVIMSAVVIVVVVVVS